MNDISNIHDVRVKDILNKVEYGIVLSLYAQKNFQV